MEVVANNYMPGDPRLVEQLVYELKSQGIFDKFRKECIADVDTKPAYQNLRQRVEGSVTSFLSQQTWRPDMNKNHVREQLRKNIYESGYLETGVERIVDQVVNPKINTTFLPQVEDVVYKYLGIEKPNRSEIKKELKIDVTDLLPTDLEAISPESDHKDDSLNFNDSFNSESKMDEDESPPFEPIDIQQPSIQQEENSVDSHLSGFSGLQSHDSNPCTDSKVCQMDISNQDSQASQNSSESRLSIVTSEDNTKMEIKEDSNSKIIKSSDSNSEMEISPNETQMASDCNSIQKDEVAKCIDETDTIKSINVVDDKSLSDELNEKEVDQKEDNIKKVEEKQSEEKKYIDKQNDDKKSRNFEKYDSKDRKDEKHRKSSSSSRDKDKSSSKYSSSSSSKDRDKNKDRKDAKSSTSSSKTKDKNDKDRDKTERDKVKSEKDKDKSEKEKERDRKDKSEKDKSEKEKSTKEKEKYMKDKDKMKNSSSSSSSSKHSSSKDRDKSSNSTKSDSSKKDKEKLRSSSSSSSKDSKSKSNHSDSKSKSSSLDKYKKDDKSNIKHSSSSSSSKKDKDKKKDLKKESKDDHYSSKDKKNNRRSTDRDSNDGRSGREKQMNSNGETNSSQSQKSSQESSNSNSGSGSGDSGTSDQSEHTVKSPMKIEEQGEITKCLPITDTQTFKYIKPKFASNFQEARKLMKIRKQLAKLERQNQLSLAQIDIPRDAHFLNGLNNTKAKILASETKPAEELDSEQVSEDTPILESRELSKENWEAFEARLAQEMSNVNCNSYESHYDDYDCGTYNSIEMSPERVISNSVEVSSVEEIVENVNTEEEEVESVIIESSDQSDPVIKEKDIATVHKEQETVNVPEQDSNLVKTTDGMIVLLENCRKSLEDDTNENDQKSLNISEAESSENTEIRKEDIKMDIDTNEKVSTNEKMELCFCLNPASPRLEKEYQFVKQYIEKLEQDVEHSLKTFQNNFVPYKRKYRKRKLVENVDFRNNNKAHYEQTLDVKKKRSVAPSLNSVISKANKEKLCNSSDISPNDSFSLPLSPAESDKSSDKKEEVVRKAKQKREINSKNISTRSQRYSSEDLYKPRPLFPSSRRRGAKIMEEK